MDFYISGLTSIVLDWIYDDCKIPVQEVSDFIKGLIVKKRLKKLLKKLKNDYNKRTVVFAFLSVLAIICFTVYNGILGFLFDSIWHIRIFPYYVFFASY